jgi:taurine--2-oxoglutarate transaminase
VRAVRSKGLFAMVDLQRDENGTPIAGYGESHPTMKAFKKALLDAGVYAYCRWSNFMCLPPLCITEAQLMEGLDMIDAALEVTDMAFEGA